MKKQTFRNATVAVFFALVVSLIGTITSVRPSRSEETLPRVFNPLRVALLAWYPANQTASFAAGPAPFGIAFDGASIWVTNRAGVNTVTQIQAADGILLGTFNVGIDPLFLAFDGANIWVANQGSNNVTKLRASDGTVVGTFNVGNVPSVVAFDGASIWLTNRGSNTVTKLRASDGTVLGTFNVGARPFGVAFDGSNI